MCTVAGVSAELQITPAVELLPSTYCRLLPEDMQLRAADLKVHTAAQHADTLHQLR